jgi:hypothetical protein
LKAELDAPPVRGFVRNYFARKKFIPTGRRHRFFLCHLPAGIPDLRENAMHKASIITALILMLSFIGPAAHAQIAPQQTPSQPQQTPSQDVLAPAPKLNLTLEQRHTIKEFVKDMKADAADVQATIGEPIPPGITPRPMPSDVSQKVPQVKAHRFFLTAQQIVIVDPKDNKVADVIKLGAD